MSGTGKLIHACSDLCVRLGAVGQRSTEVPPAHKEVVATPLGLRVALGNRRPGLSEPLSFPGELELLIFLSFLRFCDLSS